MVIAFVESIYHIVEANEVCIKFVPAKLANLNNGMGSFATYIIKDYSSRTISADPYKIISNVIAFKTPFKDENRNECYLLHPISQFYGSKKPIIYSHSIRKFWKNYETVNYRRRIYYNLSWKSDLQNFLSD